MRIILIVCSFILCGCLVSAQPSVKTGLVSSKPFVLGVTDELYSSQLSEKRTLNIYLPEGYNENDTIHYPVIYLLDGGADEDFIHITGIVQFNTFSWINRMPKSIVVGIANTDRQRDLTFPTTVKINKEKFPTTGGSAKFMAFLEKDLQPYIQQKYKASNSKTLIGESLGGLFAAEVLLTKPNLFDKYIIVSPSIWWDNGSILKKQIVIAGKPHVYIGVGKEGLTPGDEPRVMEVDANLLAEKLAKAYGKNISLYFDYLPEETHATIMHLAVFNAFRKLYPVTEK